MISPSPDPRPGGRRPPGRGRARAVCTPRAGGVGRDAAARTLGAAAAALLAALLAACGPEPRVPRGVKPPPSPFERLPYLQGVHGDSAVVRWRVRPGAGGAFRWRIADGRWRDAPVRDLGGGDRRAVLAGLPPGGDVRYRVRAGDVEVGPYAFRPAPSDTAAGEVDVLAFGDSGWGGRAQVSLARLMEEGSWDLAVHVGDIAYPDGSERDLTVRHFGVYGDLFARVPFFPVPGNHDLHTAGGRPYDRAFEGPGGRAPTGPGARRYAFRWGRAVFVAVATTPKAVRDSLAAGRGSQYRWLDERLAAAARDTTVAWTVVFTHYPLYSHAVGFSGHGPSVELREGLEPLFLEHGVDLVLTGHDHHYERTHPLRRGRVVERGCGPVYMVIGGGGARRYARSIAPDGQVARIDRAHHFLHLGLGAAAATGRAVGTDGRVFDRFRVLPYEPSSEEERCG